MMSVQFFLEDLDTGKAYSLSNKHSISLLSSSDLIVHISFLRLHLIIWQQTKYNMNCIPK